MRKKDSRFQREDSRRRWMDAVAAASRFLEACLWVAAGVAALLFFVWGMARLAAATGRGRVGFCPENVIAPLTRFCGAGVELPPCPPRGGLSNGRNPVAKALQNPAAGVDAGELAIWAQKRPGIAAGPGGGDGAALGGNI